MNRKTTGSSESSTETRGGNKELAKIIEQRDVLQNLADINYALDQSSIVAVTNQRGIILHVNDQFCKISKYNADELIGKDHSLLNSKYHSRDFFKNMWATIGNGKVWRGEIRNKTKVGTLYWVDTTIVPFLNDKGKPYQYISIRNDITNRKEMEKAVQKSEEMYRLITENSSDLISIIDKTGKFQYVSPSHQTILGFPISEIETSNLMDWVHEADRKYVNSNIHKSISKVRSIQLEFQIRTKTGDYIYVETKINQLPSTNNEENNKLLVMRDITERKKSERMIKHMAYHDSLTELPNRRLFMKDLIEEIDCAKQTSTKLAVMFLDLDRFKYVNDSWGHEMGDLILTEAAKRIKNSIRSTDLVARLGGDEFTVLLTNIKNADEVEKLTKRIQSEFEEPVKVAGKLYTITFSIGIALYPENGIDADEILARADTALYAVKEQGRSGYAFFHKDMEKKSLERALLENELKKAIEHEQFYIDYQPKIDFKNGTLIGMEALIRWNHPELGRIPPNKFIPLAEETGMILPIGEWVLRNACKQTKEWQLKGHDGLKISVNLSAQQLADRNFLTILKNILEETAFDAKWLELEITESVFADNDEAAITLQKMRDIGIHISIDDFGTGYSSFSYIKNLPVDTLKIDASFIQDIHQNDESQAIVSAILTLAKTLRIDVIAEGIELQEQLDFLNDEACKLGQGYLFSKPLSSDDFEQYLIEHKRK